MEAEERGQGEAIARNLFTLAGLRTPVLTVITGEGGSGGALALAVADEVWMLENSVYSILSPEGFASILWKDVSRAKEAANVMRLTAQDLQKQGIICLLYTSCASGTHCIGDALRAIQYGDAVMMLAGGTESCICETGVAGFMNLTALSTETDPMRASIPFDQDRSGFVLGEGAGVVMLEELNHAKERGAKIYAELCGYGATADAYHITSPAEDGAGAARAMQLAMQEAGILPSEVDYINAHGTGTHHNDLFETRAIHRAFGDAAHQLHINSTKSMIGHLLLSLIHI